MQRPPTCAPSSCIRLKSTRRRSQRFASGLQEIEEARHRSDERGASRELRWSEPPPRRARGRLEEIRGRTLPQKRVAGGGDRRHTDSRGMPTAFCPPAQGCRRLPWVRLEQERSTPTALRPNGVLSPQPRWG